MVTAGRSSSLKQQKSGHEEEGKVKRTRKVVLKSVKKKGETHSPQTRIISKKRRREEKRQFFVGGTQKQLFITLGVRKLGKTGGVGTDVRIIESCGEAG